jgi:membrane protein DedA with SNARE-associated domain
MASWVIAFISSTGYWGIVLLMLVENVFPPIPSELIMPLAGFMVAQDELTFVGTTLAGMAGSVLGALPFYCAGKKLGEERVKRFADRYGRWLTVSRQDIERASRWFHRHGGVAVFLCRLIPGVRSLISIPAGIAGMNLVKFLFYTSLGTALWAGLLAYVGYLLGNNFTKVGEYLDPVSWIVFGSIAALYIARVFMRKGAQA